MQLAEEEIEDERPPCAQPEPSLSRQDDDSDTNSVIPMD
jgi:hypothetical protein